MVTDTKAGGFAGWLRDFEEQARARAAAGDPEWARGARLEPCVVRSLQRFQVGEDGDGAFLIGKAERAGDAEYAAAVRLFIAEEQNHARMLGRLLDAAGAGTIGAHWSDAIFVRARRAMGLRVELMVLLVAEVIALGFYRALYEGAGDPLAAEVAGRLLADERRHVPFHCRRMRQGLERVPRPLRAAALLAWRAAVAGGALIIVADHGRALRRLGRGRARFVRDVLAEARAAAAEISRPPGRGAWPRRRRPGRRPGR
ncbi:ferritin-like domain-containing protein [Actinomadura vinacea]|uniref:Ferritin-like domain-containing protein n=1 Tax=Actinomadura vinacea TaxID=115336 RepID=A0ABP5VIH9_9ACTN